MLAVVIGSRISVLRARWIGFSALWLINCKHSVNPVGGKIANELSGHAPDFPLVSVW